MLNLIIAGMLMAAPLPDLIPWWSLVIPLLSSFSAQAKLEVVLFSDTGQLVVDAKLGVCHGEGRDEGW